MFVLLASLSEASERVVAIMSGVHSETADNLLVNLSKPSFCKSEESRGKDSTRLVNWAPAASAPPTAALSSANGRNITANAMATTVFVVGPIGGPVVSGSRFAVAVSGPSTTIGMEPPCADVDASLGVNLGVFNTPLPHASPSNAARIES